MPGIDSKENTYRVRQKNPGLFKGGYATYTITPGVQKVDADLKSGDRACQTLLFSKDKFKTKDSVRAWIKRHPQYKVIGSSTMSALKKRYEEA